MSSKGQDQHIPKSIPKSRPKSPNSVELRIWTWAGSINILMAAPVYLNIYFSMLCYVLLHVLKTKLNPEVTLLTTNPAS